MDEGFNITDANLPEETRQDAVQLSEDSRRSVIYARRAVLDVRQDVCFKMPNELRRVEIPLRPHDRAHFPSSSNCSLVHGEAHL